MPVKKYLARPLVYAAMAAFLLTGSSLAQTKEDAGPQEDKVVAIVNGHEIKVSEVEMAAEDILGQLPDVPPQLRYPYIVEYLVERHLLAQAAVKDGVAESEEYKRRLALYQAKALRDAYYAEKIKPTVTEEEIKAAYDTESAKVAQTERVRARHILVRTEAEAKQIVERLNAGEKFADVAKKYSLDGSKEYGGDLGYFTAAEMVPEFSKAAFALEGWRSIGTGQNRFRLAHHHGRRPQDGRCPAISIRSRSPSAMCCCARRRKRRSSRCARRPRSS